jgi:hypothetical protein
MLYAMVKYFKCYSVTCALPLYPAIAYLPVHEGLQRWAVGFAIALL